MILSLLPFGGYWIDFDFTLVRTLTEEEVEYIHTLPIRQLKTILSSQKCPSNDCIEKGELIERLKLCVISKGIFMAAQSLGLSLLLSL